MASLGNIELVIRTTYPCCNRQARIKAVDFVRKQTVTRTCKCGKKWDITITLITQNPDMWIHKLEWEEV